jgi:ABC-type phosphonate transport system ATPase subunit
VIITYDIVHQRNVIIISDGEHKGFITCYGDKFGLKIYRLPIDKKPRLIICIDPVQVDSDIHGRLLDIYNELMGDIDLSKLDEVPNLNTSIR